MPITTYIIHSHTRQALSKLITLSQIVVPMRVDENVSNIRSLAF